MDIIEIKNKISDILDDPCGRHPEYYGPSKTEESIVALAEIVKELAEENERLKRRISRLEPPTPILKY